jgi:putative transposase
MPHEDQNIMGSVHMQSSVYTVEDTAWTIAVQRSDVLRPLAEKQRLSLCEVNEAARLLQISIPHVYRLIRLCCIIQSIGETKPL